MDKTVIRTWMGKSIHILSVSFLLLCFPQRWRRRGIAMAAGLTRWRMCWAWLSPCALIVRFSSWPALCHHRLSLTILLRTWAASLSECWRFWWSYDVYATCVFLDVRVHLLKAVCLCVEKCPSGWHHYEKTSSCYKVYEQGENYWQAGETCQSVNGNLATFSTNEELQFILKIDQRVCERRDQCRSVSALIHFVYACNQNSVKI